MMPIIEKFLYPFLLVLKDGELPNRDIRNKLIVYFGLSDDDIEQRTRQGNSYQLDNRISWCRQYLKWALFIEIPKRGICKLTERGKDFLKNHDTLTIDDLMKYPEFAMNYAMRYIEKHKSDLDTKKLDSRENIEDAIVEEHSEANEQILALYIEYSNFDQSKLASIIYSRLGSYINQIHLREEDFAKSLSEQKEKLEEEKSLLINLFCRFLEQRFNPNDSNLFYEIRDSCDRIISLYDNYQKTLQIQSTSSVQIKSLELLCLNLNSYFHLGGDDYTSFLSKSKSCFLFFYEMPDKVFDIINRFDYPTKFISELIVILAPILATYWGIDKALITAILTYTLNEYLKTLYEEKKFLRISETVKSVDKTPLIEAPAGHKKKTKTPTTGLRVEFPDGTVICHKNAIETFIASLKKIGLKTVSRLKEVKHNGYTLVSKKKRPTTTGRIWQHECDGWYVYSNISNDQKIKDLKKISDLLSLGLIISKEKPKQ